MKRTLVLGMVAVALTGASGTALADWTGKGELGGSFASGNSETEAVNAAVAADGPTLIEVREDSPYLG